MEDVFDRRFRVIFDRLCAGAWNHLDRVVIPRTSEQEHKLYLYLREIARTQPAGATPELYFYNLLHTRTPESYDYGLERTRQMMRDFNTSEHELRPAIAESNRARGCVRDILQKRREGCLEGSAAIEMIRGFYSEDRGMFADRVLDRLKQRVLSDALRSTKHKGVVNLLMGRLNPMSKPGNDVIGVIRVDVVDVR